MLIRRPREVTKTNYRKPLKNSRTTPKRPHTSRLSLSVFYPTRRGSLSNENEKLYNELWFLREENTRLSNLSSSGEPLIEALSNPAISLPNPPNCLSLEPISQVSHKSLSSDVDCCERKEMSRSLIVSGVPECNSPRSFDCVNYDFDCVSRLFSFLAVPCRPISIGWADALNAGLES